MNVLFFLFLGTLLAWEIATMVLWIGSLFFANLQGKSTLLPELIILIPAHNEASVIGQTLSGLKKAPAKVMVVADHCSDNTAELASRMGVEVLVLSGRKNSTKARALAAAIERLKDRSWTYLMILDADNVLSDNFWQVLPKILSLSPEVVQVEVRPSNKNTSLNTEMITVLYAFLNRVVQRGRQGLSLGARLCGTGMIFRRDVILEKVPLKEHLGLVEDIAYQIKLMEKGIRATWTDSIYVLDEKPYTFKAGVVQGSRWLRGRLEIARQLRQLFYKKPLLATTVACSAIPKPVFWISSALVIINSLSNLFPWKFLTPCCLVPWLFWVAPSFIFKPYRVGSEALIFPFWQMASQVLQLVQAQWDRGKGWRPTRHYGSHQKG